MTTLVTGGVIALIAVPLVVIAVMDILGDYRRSASRQEHRAWLERDE